MEGIEKTLLIILATVVALGGLPILLNPKARAEADPALPHQRCGLPEPADGAPTSLSVSRPSSLSPMRPFPMLTSFTCYAPGSGADHDGVLTKDITALFED